MALHWAENYAASFKAGLSKIFGLEQGANIWDRVMAYWHEDAEHNPQAAPEAEAGHGAWRWRALW